MFLKTYQLMYSTYAEYRFISEKILFIQFSIKNKVFTNYHNVFNYHYVNLSKFRTLKSCTLI